MIPLDLGSDPPVALVNGERLTAKDLEDATRSAVYQIHREIRRRRDLANREREEHLFRTNPSWAHTVVDTAIGDTPVLLALYKAVGELWPIGFDPATGRTLEHRECQWTKLDPSPWGPLWMRITRRHKAAHLWTGGHRFVCGLAVPGAWERKECAVADAYVAGTPSLSMGEAVRCGKCGAAESGRESR